MASNPNTESPLIDSTNITLESEAQQAGTRDSNALNGGDAVLSADKSVDSEMNETSDARMQYVGLNKEELLKYANDPFWVKVRIVMVILLVLAWFAMLASTIIIIALAPKCPYRAELEWWQKTSVYQIYTRSFQDTDGDGVGDINGITKHLDYLSDTLGVSSLQLDAIYLSSGADARNGITDHKTIDPLFGTMNDFRNLVKKMNKKKMKLILTFIPNHTSREHNWFAESENSQAGSSRFEDYYVWHKGVPSLSGNLKAPNNWMNMSGQSAWEYNKNRQAYYYHVFSANQPDLNLTNQNVIQELDDILMFWLKEGVSGFYVDSTAYLVESKNVTVDEPHLLTSPAQTGYHSLDHIYTTYQPETRDLVIHWTELLNNYSNNDGRPKSHYYPRLLIVESYGTGNQTVQLAHGKQQRGAHLATNMGLVRMTQGCEALCIHSLVRSWMDVAQSTGVWSNWQLGNEDSSRVLSRLGDERYANALNMLLLTLPGTSFTYYGEEIGMQDVNISYDLTKDPLAKLFPEESFHLYSRDPQRTPMQWTSGNLSDFTNASEAWLPLAGNYRLRNVEHQSAHGAGLSNIKMFSTLCKLRNKEPSFLWGDLDHAVEDSIYFYVRQAAGFPAYLIAINFGPSASTVNFVQSLSSDIYIPNNAELVTTTGNIVGYDRNYEYKIGSTVALSNVYLQPTEGVMFRWEPKREDGFFS